MGHSACRLCGLPSFRTHNEEVLKVLAQVTIFKQVPPETAPALAAISERVRFEPNATIIRQGDPGEEFFVIIDGTASVVVDGVHVAKLKRNDYFGERALICDEPRAATITALTEVTLIKLSRADFRQFGLHDNVRFAHRKAVGGGDASSSLAQPPSPKTTAERALMTQALRSNAYLQGMLNLEDRQIQQIIGLAWKENVPAGMEVVSEGDLAAEFFYIVQEGSFDVSICDVGGVSIRGAMARAHIVGNVIKGGSFGELALLYAAPRNATVRATVSSVVWVIDRKNFKDILTKTHGDDALKHMQYFDKVELLAPLQHDEKQALARALMEMHFTKDETMFRQGEKGDALYILVEGEVAVLEDGVEVNRLASTAEKAQFFGDLALINSASRTATVTVVSESAKALCLDRESFNMLLRPLEELQWGGGSRGSRVKAASAVPPINRKLGLVKWKDLEVLGLLGCGAFGAVQLVEHKETKETYALKTISKGYIVKMGAQSGVFNEKNVWLMCDSLFIIKLFETFTEEQFFRFLIEPALGGELYTTYSRKGLHGKEGHARFYVAGVVLAFEHLHSRKVIYRDLKPENLMLTEKGHVKLTDMGLAKVSVGTTYTVCGTPDYFAPEMVLQRGHTHAVDWWTLGILTYELMTGHPPFEAPTPNQTFHKVKAGISKVKFPAALRGDAEDLVKELCCWHPSKRLPMKAGGVDNIKAHLWLANFDWSRMADLTLQPPYMPLVSSKRDLTNFMTTSTEMPPHIPYKDTGSDWDKDFATSS